MANIIDVPGQFRAREYGVKLANMSDIQDNVYGPYESVAAAHTALSAISMNAVGTTVGITGADNTIVEYWYQGGTAQANLVPKKPNLAPVAISGSYNDLTDKPTIPAPVDVSGKADKAYVDAALAQKANTNDVNTALAGKANTADVNTALGNKQDTIQDLSTIRDGAALGRTAKQPATTLEGYGITDAYTKTEGQALESEVNGAISDMQDELDLLNGNDVIVVADHTAVATPDSQKIYREPNDANNPTAYTDWMYQNNAWKPIATYDFPGVDDEPTADSENLVKSGGVYDKINDLEKEISSANDFLVINQRSNDLDYNKEDIVFEDSLFKTDKYININGIEESLTGMYATEFIQIPVAYNKCHVESKGISSQDSYDIVFYNANKTKISGGTQMSSNSTYINNYNIPSGAKYFRCNTSDKSALVVYFIPAATNRDFKTWNLLNNMAINLVRKNGCTYEDVTYTSTDRYLYYDSQKGYYFGTYPGYGMTSNIEVSPYDIYYIEAITDQRKSRYVFLDAGENIIYVDKSNNTTTLVNQTFAAVVVPPNAKYLTVIIVGNNTPVIKKVTGIAIDTWSKKWVDKKWCLIGDSLTKVNDKSHLTNYHYFINKHTGIQLFNYGQDGNGYRGAVDGWHSDRLFKLQIDNAFNSREEFDVITIFGSGNDISPANLELGTKDDVYNETTQSGNTIAGWINYTLNYLFEKFTYTKVIVFTPTPWKGFEPNVANNRMMQYCDMLIEICKARGIYCVDLYRTSGMHPDNSDYRAHYYSRDGNDGIHPDEKAHEFILAPIFMDALNRTIGDY